ncbi:hypothetical protein TNCV_1376551 [Trichonephila clavipes]|nr:hypothetical protein TNCV_1376551 [Trichonephila clavipes]
MPSTYRCAVYVPEMTTKSVRLSKEMKSRTIASICESVWRAIVRAGSYASLDVSEYVCGFRQGTVGNGTRH